MSSEHETIKYDDTPANNVRDLIDTTVLTGTIITVYYEDGLYDYIFHYADTTKVDISGLGIMDDVPIFYHCADSAVVAGGSIAFAEGDSVYVLNKEGDLTITGFVDGLKSCGWKLKLYRDDDTTIRDEAGNITTPSGLPIDLYAISFIHIYSHDGVDFVYHGGLAGNTSNTGYSEYWTYDAETGIWTYDASAYPGDLWDDWIGWKGTYDTNTGYFTMEHSGKSADNKYWISYDLARPCSKTDPAINEVTSTAQVDGYVGVRVYLTKAGNNQTLQPPTDTLAGKTYVVKADEDNRTNTLTVNGITLSAGMTQGFLWNGSSWETSSVDLMYGYKFNDVQYPYRYKVADKYQEEDKISIGTYEANIPYWNEYGYTFDPIPASEGVTDCPGNVDVVNIKFSTAEAFTNPFKKIGRLKASIPYKIKYTGALSNPVYKGMYTDNCASPEYCWYITTDSEHVFKMLSDDGVLNVFHPEGYYLKHATSGWQSRPLSIDDVNLRAINVSMLPVSYYYICRNYEWDEETEKWVYVGETRRSTNLSHAKTRSVCDSSKIEFLYE